MSTTQTGSRRSAHTTAWLLVLALLAAMTLPMLTRSGMFIDGIYYGAVSRNLAVGIGDAWHPVYTETYMSEFREHPTLGFVLESWWFRMLGDHYWVERLYSLTTAVVSGGLIVLLWRRLARDNARVQACAWLPILLWVLISGWRGAYGNNVLENTLGCFTLLAVYSLLRAIESRAALWLPLAAGSIVAALFTKGPVGLFPLATLAIARLTLSQRGRLSPTDESAKQDDTARPFGIVRLARFQTVVVALIAAGVALVLLDADALQYLREYWQQQVVASLSGRREIVNSSFGRLFILVSLAMKLLAPAAIAVLSVAIARRRKLDTPGSATLGRATWFCLLTGLSASLPLAISPKQLSFYTSPSWPFYAMALALWCAPSMAALLDHHYRIEHAARRHRQWRLLAGGATVVSIVVAIAMAGTPQRDRAALADAAAIAQHVPPHTTVSMAPGLGPHGPLHAYLYRTHYISVSFDVCPSMAGFRLDANTAGVESAGSESSRPGQVLLKTDRLVLRGPMIVQEETAAARDETISRP